MPEPCSPPRMPEQIAVRRVRMSEADRVRSIRLEALRDPAAAIAFLETLEQAEQRPLDFWQERAIGAALSADAAQFIAESGRDWVGTVSVLISDGDDSLTRAGVVAVYVRPSHRGSGILDSLLESAAEWARGQGRDELVLDVHVENARAQRAYERLGFRASGETWESSNGLEREMVRVL